LPEVKLDGELWMGRGTFEQLLAVVNGTLKSPIFWREKNSRPQKDDWTVIRTSLTIWPTQFNHTSNWNKNRRG